MIVVLCILAIAAIIWFLYWQDNAVLATKYAYSNKKITSALNGFKIVHISDLHNKQFGKHQQRLLDIVRNAAPDIIIISGDLIDCHRTDIDSAMELIYPAVQIAPVYFAPGNHECKSHIYGELFPRLETAGVHVLNNGSAQVRHNNTAFTILGVMDIEFLKKNKEKTPVEDFYSVLTDLCKQKTDFSVLIAHRPEHFEKYASQDVDLVLSGHAHGGQVRLPLIGGLFAPQQGWHPKYTSGMHSLNNTTMVISRGLGNSEFPFRVFNRPEVVVITLQTDPS